MKRFLEEKIGTFGFLCLKPGGILSLFLLSRYRKAHLFKLKNFFTIHDRSMGYEPESTEWWGNVIKWAIVFCSYSFYILLLISNYSHSILLNNSYFIFICFTSVSLYYLIHYLFNLHHNKFQSLYKCFQNQNCL